MGKKYRTKLERVLAEKGILQKELHQETGIALSSISEMVSGLVWNYKPSALYEICRVTRTTPNDILDYEERVK